MKPIPQVVRDQIIAACDRGEPRGATAKKYGVSTAFIRRLLQRRRESGSYEARPHAGGQRPSISGARLTALKRLVRDRPSATVRDVAGELGASTAAVCRTLKRIGYTVKAGRYTQPERQRFRSHFADPVYTTKLGRLYEADCLKVLPEIGDDTVDLVFADPPWNLGKRYGRRGNDRRPDDEYLAWCLRWLADCHRVLKPGGTLFLYHIPRWAMTLGHHLTEAGWAFNNWVSVDVNNGMPLPGKFTPRHFALLYFSKGRPAVFNVQRLAIETCRHCGGDVKDYGGHRHEVHPDGVRLTDVWTDISAVRHRRHRHRDANHLSEKLVARCVALASRPGDLILDPFAGSGTSCVSSERAGRQWVGIELEPVDAIVRRLSGMSLGGMKKRE